MKALVYRGPEVIELSELDEPTCGPGQVLLRVLAAGVCGSDLNGYMGRSARRIPPLVLGHEVSAEVVHAPGGEPAPGTRVAVFPMISCGLVDCAACAGGHANRCERRRLMGLDLPGAFCELIVAPVNACFPLPTGVSNVGGAMIEPLANAIHLYDAILRSNGPVGRVAIIGAGGQGLTALLTGRHLGIQCDVIEPNPIRRERAVELGANAAFDPSEAAGPRARPGSSFGHGYEAIIDTAGLGSTRQLAIQIAAPGATVLYLGLHDASSTADDLNIINRELTVMGSYAYTQRDFQRALALAGTGAIDVEAFITTSPMSEAVHIFDRLAHHPGDLIKAVLLPDNGGPR